MWYDGDISGAVAQAKKTNSCLMVFIKEKTENSKHLESLFNKESITKYLYSQKFVCIRFYKDTSAYVNFASIYKFVPVPSVFFLGENGQPLEIGTELMRTAEELEAKIIKVLSLLGKSATIAAATPATTGSSASTSHSDLCEGGACALPAANKETSSNVDATASESTQKQKNLTQKTSSDHLKVLEALRDAKEREQHLCVLREKLSRDKMIEQAALERVRAQIAADRTERSEFNNLMNIKIGTTDVVAKSIDNLTSSEVTTQNNVVRLQFRMGNGNTMTHNFQSTTTLQEVREHVRTELLANARGSTYFVLATSYPKRDLGIEHDAKTLSELRLTPSAVILVIIMESVHTSIAVRKKIESVWTITRNLFMALMSPLIGIASYLDSYIGWQGQQSGRIEAAGVLKNVDAGLDEALLAARRRNAATPPADKLTTPAANDGLGLERRRWVGGSNINRMSDQRRDDDNADNATWNGNSTQQQ